MEQPPPAEQVLQALQALYAASDAQERKAANLFLVRLSERAASLPWELLWSLLAARAPEAQFCGAQLLIEKLQRTWDNVPAVDRRAVGEFLLQEVLHGYDQVSYIKGVLTSVQTAQFSRLSTAGPFVVHLLPL
jgi:hypothetical protein